MLHQHLRHSRNSHQQRRTDNDDVINDESTFGQSSRPSHAGQSRLDVCRILPQEQITLVRRSSRPLRTFNVLDEICWMIYIYRITPHISLWQPYGHYTYVSCQLTIEKSRCLSALRLCFLLDSLKYIDHINQTGSLFFSISVRNSGFCFCLGGVMFALSLCIGHSIKICRFVALDNIYCWRRWQTGANNIAE